MSLFNQPVPTKNSIWLKNIEVCQVPPLVLKAGITLDVPCGQRILSLKSPLHLSSPTTITQYLPEWLAVKVSYVQVGVNR
jgi:hypothetical protein